MAAWCGKTIDAASDGGWGTRTVSVWRVGGWLLTIVGAVPLPSPSLSLILVVGVVVVSIVGFSIVESLIARRDRRRWSALGQDAVTRRAASAVVDARARLAAAIAADERAERRVRRHPALGNLAPGNPGVPNPVSGDQGFGQEGFREEGLRQEGLREEGLAENAPGSGERAAAREALLDAQRLWESVRPRRDTRARVGLWSGRGRLRSWQFGPIGFERLVVRCDHLLDPECWVLTEYRRLRFGFGFGAESVQLALFAAATPSRRLDELIQTLLRGPEVAFRPGTAPLRRLRIVRRSPTAQSATQAVLADRRLDRPPGPQTTAAVWAAVTEDFGPDVATVGLGGLTGPIAVTHTAGLSLLFGIWWGRPARSRLVAASSHVVWRESR